MVRAAWSEGIMSKEIERSVNWSVMVATSFRNVRSRIDGLWLLSSLCDLHICTPSGLRRYRP
jgi:hypothetical protein